MKKLIDKIVRLLSIENPTETENKQLEELENELSEKTVKDKPTQTISEFIDGLLKMI